MKSVLITITVGLYFFTFSICATYKHTHTLLRSTHISLHYKTWRLQSCSIAFVSFLCTVMSFTGVTSISWSNHQIQAMLMYMFKLKIHELARQVHVWEELRGNADFQVTMCSKNVCREPSVPEKHSIMDFLFYPPCCFTSY